MPDDKTEQYLILPCLIDRLTDNDPANEKESRMSRALSLRAFRAAVLRDLSWLLNSATLFDEEAKQKYPYIADSVLNYGISSFSGKIENSAQEALLRASVTESIKRFEPRIIPDSLVINIIHSDNDTNKRPTKISLEIKAIRLRFLKSYLLKQSLTLKSKNSICNMADTEENITPRDTDG